MFDAKKKKSGTKKYIRDRNRSQKRQQKENFIRKVFPSDYSDFPIRADRVERGEEKEDSGQRESNPKNHKKGVFDRPSVRPTRRDASDGD